MKIGRLTGVILAVMMAVVLRRGPGYAGNRTFVTPRRSSLKPRPGKDAEL